MPKQKVDIKDVNKRLLAGESPVNIAEYYKVKRQTIDLYRQQLVKDGKLSSLPRGRKGRPRKAPAATPPSYEWTDIQEALLKTIEQAKLVETLSSENEQLKARVELLAEQLGASEAQVRELIETDQRYRVAVQKGDIPMPLIRK